MFISVGGAYSARMQAKVVEAEARVREAMEDMRQLNELQSLYRDWVKMPRFVKCGAQWFAEVWYPPLVPRVKRKP